MADPEDELARTATAPLASSAPTLPVTPVGVTLGRYRLEHELGSGGMGVVHAAFDPDLERRIALKVLRTAETADARGRLLREARAMARLAHPNVVTVHEVGSAAGRDYVAMELIHGETLAEWLRAAPRSQNEILAAFVAAGRGLAAAHAAGIVHRDFKPHNVLRSRNEGRIVVTDFGLARDAAPDPLTTTVPARPGNATAISESTPSSLAGLTQTGSVLGTPAYMAPEQWRGAQVTPATDQFAYCVAMWEALAGERPYRAVIPEQLRAEVERGPAALDASKLPRRLRNVLRRGLDPVPTNRWPSMDALLVAIDRAEKRPARAVSLILILVGATAGLLVYQFEKHHTAPGQPPCPLPPRESATVWSAPLAGELPPAIAAVFAHDFERLDAARSTACAAPEAVRAPQLRCLDNLMLRFDAVRRSIVRVGKATEDDAAQLLVEPGVCLALDPPRLAVASTPDTVRAFELYAKTLAEDAHLPEAPVAELLGRADLDPCARAIAQLALANTTTDVPKQRTAVNEAIEASEQCGDDHLRAEALVSSAPYHFELPVVGPKGQAAIQRAEVAARRVNAADLLAPIETMRGLIASQQENWAETFARFDKALARYGERGLARRQLGVIVEMNALHFARGLPEDDAAITSAIAKWRPIAAQLHSTRATDQLARDEAHLKFRHGDVAGAHAELMGAWRPRLEGDATRHLEGIVVDAAGKPVAGATVAAADRLVADSIAVPLPPMNLHEPDAHLRVTTSDGAGHFAFDSAPQHGVAIASLGDRRSLARPIGDGLKLVLAPTRKVTGKVALGGQSSARLTVEAELVGDISGAYHLIAPVAADGSFVLAGVPTDRIEVSVAIPTQHYGHTHASKRLPPGTADVTDLALAVPTGGRAIDVIARSELPIPLDFAQVIVLAGRVKLATVADLIKESSAGFQIRFAHAVVGEKLPPALVGLVRPGDLVAHYDSAPLGEITVCAVGLNGDMMDAAAMAKIQQHIGEVGLRCEVLGPDAAITTLETPPQKRFE